MISLFKTDCKLFWQVCAHVVKNGGGAKVACFLKLRYSLDHSAVSTSSPLIQIRSFFYPSNIAFLLSLFDALLPNLRHRNRRNTFRKFKTELFRILHFVNFYSESQFHLSMDPLDFHHFLHPRKNLNLRENSRKRNNNKQIHVCQIDQG